MTILRKSSRNLSGRADLSVQLNQRIGHSAQLQNRENPSQAWISKLFQFTGQSFELFSSVERTPDMAKYPWYLPNLIWQTLNVDDRLENFFSEECLMCRRFHWSHSWNDCSDCSTTRNWFSLMGIHQKLRVARHCKCVDAIALDRFFESRISTRLRYWTWCDSSDW